MPAPATHSPTVLWWSRSGREYSRNRIVRDSFLRLGWTLVDFAPLVSLTADLEASLRRLPTPDLVWVPCFRQRDGAAAVRWSRRRGSPVVFDPLISAYDKQVFERQKFAETSRSARRLKQWEAALMRRFDRVIADTDCHAAFFYEEFGVPTSALCVIPVGAEQGLFTSQAAGVNTGPVRVMFYGSFIGLQGPEVIAAAARLTPELDWTLIGDGPLKSRCVDIAGDARNVRFIPWIPYEDLPAAIGVAEILLGVFGESRKAGRVIPNKVFQSLACARLVVTRPSSAYPSELVNAGLAGSGLSFIEAGQPERLASELRELAAHRNELAAALGLQARQSYERYFSESSIDQAAAGRAAIVGAADSPSRRQDGD
ncbi:MAG: glycosyltransferase [Planctomycetaceae bacterium]